MGSEEEERRRQDDSNVSIARRVQGIEEELRSRCNQVLFHQAFNLLSVQRSQLSHQEGRCSYSTPSVAFPMK